MHEVRPDSLTSYMLRRCRVLLRDLQHHKYHDHEGQNQKNDADQIIDARRTFSQHIGVLSVGVISGGAELQVTIKQPTGKHKSS